MFGLREKLSLSFAALLIIVLALGAQTIRHLMVLEAKVTDITESRFESVLAAGDIQEGLGRLDSGVLSTMMGSPLSGTKLIEDGRAQAARGLTVLATWAAQREEAAHVDELAEAYRTYVDAVEAALAGNLAEEAFEERYADVLKPYYNTAIALATVIEENSQNKVMALNLQARQRVRDAKLQTLVVLGIAFFIAVAAIYATGRYILVPILQLTHSAEEVRSGNLDVELPPASNDELGRLTMAFNQMAASLKALRTTEKAELLKLHLATERIFGSLRDAIALVTTEGIVEVATPVACDAFGLVRGGSVHDTQAAWVRELFDRACAADRPVRFDAPKDVVQQFIGNDEYFFYPEGLPILDEDGKVRGVVLMIHDITQLREQSELKRDVVSTVSHQLKTPLTSIRMAHHLLLDGKMGPLTDKQEDLIQTARDESDRLYRMVEGLLDINRIKSGRVSMECAPMPAAMAVQLAAEPFEVQAKQGGVTLEVSLPDDLPELWVDATRIEHVFSNLISNALKYTPAGGSVSVRAAAEEEFVRVDVVDTGQGIPYEYQDQIFNQFFRVPNQDGVSGAGLGLAIVRQIVEAHGGTITVCSEPGGGTTFVVRVPRADCAQALGLVEEAGFGV